MNRLAGRREWLGSAEATSTRGKHLTGRAFATRVRRITDHLNDKISHIRIESRNIVMGCDTARGLTVRRRSARWGLQVEGRNVSSYQGATLSRAVEKMFSWKKCFLRRARLQPCRNRRTDEGFSP